MRLNLAASLLYTYSWCPAFFYTPKESGRTWNKYAEEMSM